MEDPQNSYHAEQPYDDDANMGFYHVHEFANCKLNEEEIKTTENHCRRKNYPLKVVWRSPRYRFFMTTPPHDYRYQIYIGYNPNETNYNDVKISIENMKNYLNKSHNIEIELLPMKYVICGCEEFGYSCHIDY